MGAGVSPLDEELALLTGGASARLLEGMTRLASWMPFAQAAEHLAFFWAVRVSEATVRRQTEAAGAAYVAVQTAEVAMLLREHPPVPPGPALQQVSADGAMVPLVGGEWAEVKTVAIGSVEREGATGAVHTDALSYFSRLTDHAHFTHLALCETHRRGVATAGTVVGVMDGSPWLQGFLDYHRPDAVRILDFPHAVEHLSRAAQATFGPGTAATAQWLEEHAHLLKHGDPVAVLAAVRALPTATARDPVAAGAAGTATVRYLEARRSQIAYAQFQADGYPIGSGVVESANKLVVEARLKGSGMHWAESHVNPMLGLRTIACSNRWHEAWPQIVTYQRTQAIQRRRAAATTETDVPAPPARQRKQRTTGVPHLPPLRATTTHPWRRPAVAPARTRDATLARD